jgi:hypothetical protein
MDHSTVVKVWLRKKFSSKPPIKATGHRAAIVRTATRPRLCMTISGFPEGSDGEQ